VREASAHSKAVFVCAHGAGGHMDDQGMLRLAAALEARGFEVLRFNFPYREAGSSRPDPMGVLKESISSVVKHVLEKQKPNRLVIGGRSMGGRAASMLAADGFACDGLLLAAYPLHPAGQPEKLRDALCRRDLMERALATLQAPWRMHWLEGADHSFHVLKSSGRTDAQIYAEVGEASARWLSELA